jgi:transposase-like protein
LTNAKTFNRDSHEKALNLLRDGASYEDVASEFGVKPDTIYRLAKRRNLVGARGKTNHPVVTFRLPEDELKAFDALVLQYDFKSRSELARALARGASGFLEVSQRDNDDLHAIHMELRSMGRNLNQLTKAANARRVELVRTQWEDVRELKASLVSLRGYVSQLSNEVRRRSTALWRKSEYGS